MRRLIYLIVIVAIISGCSKTRKYKYVETVKEKDLLSDYYHESSKDTDIITASNDSIAYLRAYKKFCISKKVSKDMFAEGIGYAIPLKFVLYDENGRDVLPYIPQNVLDSIEAHIMKLERGLGETLSEAKRARQQPVDSAAIRELSPLFKFDKDEFDPKGKTWIKPKSAPKYVDMNGMYCYFMQDNDGVSNFRIQIQYYSEDWLFIRKYQFSVDGKAYELLPGNVERDNGGGSIWEWCDVQINTDDEKELIKALSTAKNAKIKFVGDQYHKIRTIKEAELKSIKNTLDLYKAMGGEW